MLAKSPLVCIVKINSFVFSCNQNFYTDCKLFENFLAVKGKGLNKPWLMYKILFIFELKIDLDLFKCKCRVSSYSWVVYPQQILFVFFFICMNSIHVLEQNWNKFCCYYLSHLYSFKYFCNGFCLVIVVVSLYRNNLYIIS